MLRELETVDVGPARHMELSLAPRLNLLTGDNGLGKSFLLDLCWWVLTGSWAGTVALPGPSSQEPRIAYRNSVGHAEARFMFRSQTWSWQKVHAGGPIGSVIYLGVDHVSAFVLGRNRFPDPLGTDDGTDDEPPAFVFRGREIWDGKLDATGRPICNGLIRDWVNWMRSRNGDAPTEPRRDQPAPFDVLERVLRVLSPAEDAPLEPGPPRRVSIRDSREIPTLRTPWQTEPVPVTLAAAGVQRVLELAYVLVWAWHEQQQAAQLQRLSPASELFILVDEPETHLHPRWQRTILPALLEVAKALDPSLELQLFVTTHSPLVLASVETIVSDERDALFHLDVGNDGVELERLDWIKHGDAVGWLGSEAIGLDGEGRSLDAMRAIRWADAFMLGQLDEIPERHRSRDAIDTELRRVLAGDDPYWTYWIVPRGDVAQ